MRAMRAWWRRIVGFIRPGAGDREFAAELQSHIDLHTDDNIRAGMAPDEARRQALARIGSVAGVAEAHRDQRGLPGLGALAFDLKLGGRMLVKYPGLTVVGGFAMAFAISVGTVIFQVLSIFFSPTVPLPKGDRLVQIRNWDVAANTADPRALYDFDIWRGTLKSVTELGAWRDATRNLIAAPGDARPVQIAEITASAFRVADGTPLLGRALTDADERADAPPVAVIGYDVWRTRFGSDPAVVGRNVQLGAERVTLVGVMREGFLFPVSHEFWMPLRVANDPHLPRSGPAISVFGLLAPGATIDTAQAELSTVGRRLESEQPATHAKMQPRVMLYAKADAPSSQDAMAIFASIHFFAVMLLVLVCSNIALLLFARAATRESELLLRTALGATRSRIIVQLFAEALVLGAAAAVVGLGAAYVVLSNWAAPFLEANLGRLPFWYDVSISPTAVMFAGGLTVLGSAIAGIVPALKVTRGMGSRLKQATPGSGGLQFGGIWTVVIVVQVAVTVAFPALVYQEQRQLRHVETFDAGFPVKDYLAARIQLDVSSTSGEPIEATGEAQRAVLAARLEELRRRVTAAPGVAAVTFVDRLPRETYSQNRIELPEDVDGTPPPSGSAGPDGPLRRVAAARIDPSYFDTLDARVLAGRPFTAADLTPDANVAIVDQGFVDEVLLGRNPIGQRVRFATRKDAAATSNPWLEIVGVVKELGMGAPTDIRRAAGLYLPARAERMEPAYMLVHLRTEPLAFAQDLRGIANAVDPALRLSEVQRLDKVTGVLAWVIRLWMRVTLVMTTVALVLSLSGIYAVLSFIVTRRTREIGVRVALGADRVRVISAIFKRPFTQVSLGVLAGNALLALAGSVKTEMPGLDGELSATGLAILSAYCVVMLAVCLLACIVPVRRALSVEPTVALRMD